LRFLIKGKKVQFVYEEEKIVFLNKVYRMNTIELKKNFHQLIDKIDNESLLKDFYELLKHRDTNEGELWNNLSNSEKEELLLALEESKNPYNLKNHDEMKKKHKKWL